MHDKSNECPCHKHNIHTCDHDIEANQHTMPLIGDPAPEFVAQTTNGTLNFPTDFAGKWVIFFSHPADFTPVCTTEFMAFQSMYADFKSLNTELIGLSVGTLTGHLAWLDAIRHIKWRGWENMQIRFPLIDDMSMKIANMYGMIHPGASNTHSVRAVFIIDPHGIVRTIFYYPPSAGRNMDEIKRTLIALQTADAFDVATPVDWTPGDDVVVGAPTTMLGVDGRENNTDKSLDVRAWFLTFKKLSKDDIFEKLNVKAKTKKGA